jgi:hypothetical protein
MNWAIGLGYPQKWDAQEIDGSTADPQGVDTGISFFPQGRKSSKDRSLQNTKLCDDWLCDAYSITMYHLLGESFSVQNEELRL